MKIDKLSSTDAFVAIDFDDASGAVGIVRQAKKILTGGAELLARSTTYGFASFGHQRGGASAGINAIGDGRDEAVTAFATELAPRIASGELSLDGGKGIEDGEISQLEEGDTRTHTDGPLTSRLIGRGAITAATTQMGDLAGRRIGIEGFDLAGLEAGRAAIEVGASITSVATPAGAAARPEGFGIDELEAAWTEHGMDCVSSLAGGEAAPFWKGLVAPVDILMPGSKTGVVTHTTTVHDDLAALVPIGPVPYSTKALATLARADVTVLPDFITTAGAIFAWTAEPSESDDQLAQRSSEAIAGVIEEIKNADDSPVLAACLRAEAFLATWRAELPYGRPMA